jgi:GxxExxY protein
MKRRINSHRPAQTYTDFRGDKKERTIMDVDELTFQIRGAVFEVNKVLGSGFLEKVYENSLIIELKNRKLKAKVQVPIKVEYKGEIVGEYFADIVVEDKIILELKAVETLQKIHEAQLLNYLKATDYKIGLLINFAYPKAEIKRFVF